MSLYRRRRAALRGRDPLAADMIRRSGSGAITYEMKGKLGGPGFNRMRFRTQGEFDLPAAGAADDAN